ncbi:MAG: lycopene cyclase domain-containing protein [Bacteroidota bacterium]
MSTYLWINIGAIIVPLIFSFDKKVAFYSRWKYFLPAMLSVAFIFVIWDIYFTRIGIWGFNPLHLSGIKIVNLPIEEVLFFIAIPYASVFTYDVLNAYIKIDLIGKKSNFISAFLAFFLLITGIIFHENTYTSVSFITTGALILLLQFLLRFRCMGRFYLTYVIVLFPFLVVNGLLTGSWIQQEVVWYNNQENLGIRLFTIPVEDFVYGMELILLNVFIYEKLKPASG